MSDEIHHTIQINDNEYAEYQFTKTQYRERRVVGGKTGLWGPWIDRVEEDNCEIWVEYKEATNQTAILTQKDDQEMPSVFVLDSKVCRSIAQDLLEKADLMDQMKVVN